MRDEYHEKMTKMVSGECPECDDSLNIESVMVSIGKYERNGHRFDCQGCDLDESYMDFDIRLVAYELSKQ